MIGPFPFVVRVNGQEKARLTAPALDFHPHGGVPGASSSLLCSPVDRRGSSVRRDPPFFSVRRAAGRQGRSGPPSKGAFLFPPPYRTPQARGRPGRTARLDSAPGFPLGGGCPRRAPPPFSSFPFVCRRREGDGTTRLFSSPRSPVAGPRKGHRFMLFSF